MSLSPLAQSLLDAHVDFTVRELSGSQLKELIASGLDDLLQQADKLRLRDVVSVSMIQETARFYAMKLQLRAAIPEIASAVGQTILQRLRQRPTSLDDIVPQRHVREFFSKMVEFKTLRERSIDEFTSNPVYARLLAELLYKRLAALVNDHTPSLVHQLWHKSTRAAHWQASLHELLINMAERSLDDAREHLKAISDETILEAMLDAWDELRDFSVSGLAQEVTPLDIEDYYVILYEYWQTLRQTDVYRDAIDAGIEAFFSVYGDCTLSELIHDVGLTREIMLGDALRFAPAIIKVLKRKKMLEPMVRKTLLRFYESAEAQALLTPRP